MRNYTILNMLRKRVNKSQIFLLLLYRDESINVSFCVDIMKHKAVT
jgi:hypothetical protein